MSGELACVLVVLIIAITTITSIVITRYYNIKENKMNSNEKYWECKYFELKNVINKAIKFDVSEDALKALQDYYLKSIENHNKNENV
jgi:hypothetical protein